MNKSFFCLRNKHIDNGDDDDAVQMVNDYEFFFFAQFNSSFIFAIAACIVVQCCIHRHFVSRETVYSKLTWIKIFVFDFGLTWLDLIIINIIMVRYIHYSSFHSKFVDFFHHWLYTFVLSFVVVVVAFTIGIIIIIMRFHWDLIVCVCVSVCYSILVYFTMIDIQFNIVRLDSVENKTPIFTRNLSFGIYLFFSLLSSGAFIGISSMNLRIFDHHHHHQHGRERSRLKLLIWCYDVEKLTKSANQLDNSNPIQCCCCFFFLKHYFSMIYFLTFSFAFPCVWVSVWKRPFIYLKNFSFHSHCLLTCSVRRLQNTKFFFSPIFYCLILTMTGLLWIT